MLSNFVFQVIPCTAIEAGDTGAIEHRFGHATAIPGTAAGDDGLPFFLEFRGFTLDRIERDVDRSFNMTAVELSRGADVYDHGTFLYQCSEISRRSGGKQFVQKIYHDRYFTG